MANKCITMEAKNFENNLNGLGITLKQFHELRKIWYELSPGGQAEVNDCMKLVPACPSMSKKELVEIALRKSKDFSKEIRQYLYEISKERSLTDKEKEFYELTHEIHIKTNDAILIL